MDMKSTIAFLVFLATSSASSAQGDWIKAPGLKPGDTIAFVSPAGPAVKERIEPFAKRLEADGFKVVFSKNLYKSDRYLGGTDDERVDDMQQAINDPKIQAIFPVRGGYGLTRIIGRLDYAPLRKHPKVIIGFSDLTALHLAVAAKAKLITFHSPLPQVSLWRTDGEFAFASKSFWRSVLADKQEGNGFLVELPTGRAKPERLVAGKAQGRLVGGNLSLICATLGTSYAIQAKGNILFLEDTGEAPYRVDRMLSQLKLAGILDDVAGVVVGSFDKTDAAAVDGVLREYLGKLRVPVVLGFPVGHAIHNATLPHGARAELDADAGALRILEAPVR